MNILLVRIGRMGDIVMILPALLALKKRYPHACFYALTTPDGVRLLRIAGLVEVDKLWSYRHTLFQRLVDTRRIKRLLRRHHFDLVYCFERKQRIINLLPAHTEVLPAQTAVIHYALRCLALVKADALRVSPYLSIPIGVNESVLAALKKNGITDKTILIGLHPTYSGYGKWFHQREHTHRLWPVDSYAMLAKRLHQFANKTGLPLMVVMDLLPSERAIGEAIIQASGGAARLLTVTGDFQRYLALISRYNVLIAANTGVMHLAAALNTPVLALFSRLHPNDCGPFMPDERCMVLRAEDTMESQRGLAAISVEKVFDGVCRLLGMAQ